MTTFTDECNETVARVQSILKEKTEWTQRYSKYSQVILENLKTIKDKKILFREWKPLHLYMTVGEAKGQMIFSLRYLGQDVAKLRVNDQNVTISTSKFDVSNKTHFGCHVKLEGDCDWKSVKAKQFRKFFSDNVITRNNEGKKNEEHRLESLLLTEFTKNISQDKQIVNIQPVKLAGRARFQMPTPLRASNMTKLEYAGPNGGGIDIISRVGTGKATKLCIIEVKDENCTKEPPAKVIQQGLAYAAFIRELLRSKSGNEWWKIFGFGGTLPQSLEIYVACAMPSSATNNHSFSNINIDADPSKTSAFPNDRFQLHYLYFQENVNQITSIASSLPKCQVKNL